MREGVQVRAEELEEEAEGCCQGLGFCGVGPGVGEGDGRVGCEGWLVGGGEERGRVEVELEVRAVG